MRRSKRKPEKAQEQQLPAEEERFELRFINTYVDVAEFSSDDSLGDPCFVPKDQTDSDSDSEPLHKPKKRKSLSVKRTEWTNDELKAIEKYLMPQVKRLGKPPKKPEITKMQEIAAIASLRQRSWKIIKWRCWAMKQQYDKVSKKLFKN